MTYTLTSGSAVIRDADSATIPANPTLSDWQNYQDWLKAGNTPTLYVAPVVVPSEVSRRKFYQAAAQQGLISEAQALALINTGALPPILAIAIAALPAAQQFAAQMSIGEATYTRADPFMTALGAAMGQTPAQIDALFTLAASF